jgi:hypothetical protein
MAITTIEIRGNPPIGCMVVQHPGESSPATLYPGTTWSNVSANFAGSFFRAEGGLAKSYGGGKQDFAMQGHWHSGPSGTGGVGQNWNDSFGAQNLTAGALAGPAITDGANGTPKIAAETRPDNFTVRIWQRTA